MKRIIYLLGFMTTSFLTTNLNAQTVSKTIVIDAGHGGSDVGSKNNAIVESQFTLEIAKKIQQLAKEKNIEVILTRDEDKIVDFENRLSKINSIKPDLVISLHVNNSQNRTTNGSEVFIYKNNTDEYLNKLEELKKTYLENLKDLDGDKVISLNEYFEYLKGQRYKKNIRIYMRSMQTEIQCTVCAGTRVSPNSGSVSLRLKNENLSFNQILKLDFLIKRVIY